MGQISTLEQQINAIESANINRETLKAMEKASEAMKQIHGKLTVEKVDETMYVFFPSLAVESNYDMVMHLLTRPPLTGRNSANRTRSATKLSKP